MAAQTFAAVASEQCSGVALDTFWVLTVTTQDGAVYSMALQEWGQHGRMLAISRSGGTDDPPIANKPMEHGRWYHVHVMTPLPPMIGTQLSMVLDPVLNDPDPLVRKTGMVTSVVGMLEARSPSVTELYEVADRSDVASVPQIEPSAAEEVIPPRAAASAVSASGSVPFSNGERKLTKSSGLFAAVLGLSAFLGRTRR